MSEEEKRTKKQKIEDNRRLRAMSQHLNMFSFTPSSSPSIVPENERFNYSIEYQNHSINDDLNNQHNDSVFLADDNNDSNDIPSIKDILGSNNKNQNQFDFKTLLNDGDRTALTIINDNYIRAVQLNISIVTGYDPPCLRNLNDITDFLNETAQMSTLRTITFLKLTPEFNVSLSCTANQLYSIYFYV